MWTETDIMRGIMAYQHQYPHLAGLSVVEIYRRLPEEDERYDSTEAGLRGLLQDMQP